SGWDGDILFYCGGFVYTLNRSRKSQVYCELLDLIYKEIDKYFLFCRTSLRSSGLPEPLVTCDL
ncbi:MAG: hypothetical protein ACI934_002243, partial [Pseudohongiellaceae bacterium]